MKSDVFKVFRTNVIKSVSAIIVTFFVPSLLSLEQYGYFKLFSLYASYIGVLHLGFCDGVFLNYGGRELKKENSCISTEFSSVIGFELIISICVVVYGILKYDLVFVMLGIDIVPVIIITFFSMIYQAVGQFDRYSGIYNLSSIITLIFNLALVFLVKIDSGYLFVGTSVAINIIVAIYAIVLHKKTYGISFVPPDFKVLFQNMKCGFLLTIGNMSYILFTSIDKWFVKGFLSMEHFAYYSFAVQLLSVLNMFVTPVSLTLYSHLSRRKDENFEKDLKKTLVSLLFFMLSGVFVIRIIIKHFLVKYSPALNIINILFLAQVFSLLNTSIYVNLFKTYKLQNKYFIKLILVIGISVLANLVFLFAFGKTMESIACATLCSMVLWSIINLFSFKYLRLSILNYLFVVLILGAFIACILLFNEVLGMIVYVVCWIILMRLLMTSTFMRLIEESMIFFRKIFR